jgi:hypothetical protein
VGFKVRFEHAYHLPHLGNTFKPLGRVRTARVTESGGRKGQGEDKLTGDACSLRVLSFDSRGIPWALPQPLNTVWLPLQYRFTCSTSGAAKAMTSALRSGLRQSLGFGKTISFSRGRASLRVADSPCFDNDIRLSWVSNSTADGLGLYRFLVLR